MSRTFAIGDIHGCLRALETLAAFVPIRPSDLVITLGDYVDRGPDSCAVLDWLCRRDQTGQLVALRGNHDALMLNAHRDPDELDIWLALGGDDALRSYRSGSGKGKLADVPETHWSFLQQTRLWHETAEHIFVHANVYPDAAMADQPERVLLWEKFDDRPPHQSGKVMVCGHTSQKSGVPRSIGHAVCIDTWVYGDGWLTCLEPGTGEYWQANQAGQTRRGWLEAVEQ